MMRQTLAPSLFLFLAACTSMTDSDTILPSRHFGTDSEGRPATLWTLRSGSIEADVTDYGATLVALRAPDRAGRLADVVLGFDDVNGYRSDQNQYFGCTTGRVCNRIANGAFSIDGEDFVVDTNNGPHHLHGGSERSFDKVFWHAEPHWTEAGEPAVRFTYLSRDGEEGYPGNLHIAVTYTMRHDGALQIDYEARSDRRTPVNVTNHAYWNLAGAGAATVLDHTLQVEADAYTPTDDTLIPTGEIASVIGTPFDLRQPLALRANIDVLAATPALGYDHNFVLRCDDDELHPAARLHDPGSGRTLTIATTEPGIQVYTGNFLFGQTGKDGATYAQRSAVCLETQHFPDAVHHAGFPDTVLEAGDLFRSTTRLTFSVE